MALTERDPNGSGHTSRASNMSAGSKRPIPPRAPSTTRSDLLSSAPGIASMLRTSTELGNLGGIAYDTSSNMPNVPRAPHRSGASSRMSTGSSRSNNSRRDSRRASTQQNGRPSSGARHSTTRNTNMPEYIADTLSPTIMNLPGSSPLIPRSGGSRDGGRTRSMTHSQPNLSLNANRSYSSLRTYDLVQRPRSPYDGHPPNFRRSGGMRPVSPAVSDHADVQHRRSQGNQGYPRMTVSSDTLVRRDLRGQLTGPPPPLRSRSPAYFANPQQHPDVPPVPPIPSHHRHKAVSQARIAHNQARASMSSNSINQRTDSEAPSSDGPSPPTPRDGASMGALVSPPGTQMVIDAGLGNAKMEQTGVLYYDGSEEYYEREELAVPDNDTIITGYGYGIRTIVEERLPLEPFQNRNPTQSGADQKEPAMAAVSGIEGRAELPASPVPRRLTRDMVLRVISEPASTTECSDTSNVSPKTKAPQEPKAQGDAVSDKIEEPKEEIVIGNHQTKGGRDFRHSIVSQAQASLMESSTLELAMRYSSPEANGTGSGSGTTEDGMSELLDGYQHTEINSKSEADMMDGASPVKEAPDKKSIHTNKSSDEQSFKSCTDLPEQPSKDTDAKSYKTCKDTVTPDRASSLPASRMPSSSLTNSETRPYRPAQEMSLSSPSAVLRKKHAFPIRESSFAKVSRMRANSKLSSRQGSTVTSISSAEGTGQQTPPVPPRESSTSKEAQRGTAVANYLLRNFRPGGRFAGFSKIRNELSSPPGSSEDVSRPNDVQNEVPDRPSDSNEGRWSESPWTNNGIPHMQGPVNELKATVKRDDGGSTHQGNSANMLPCNVVSGNAALPRIPEMQLATPVHNRSLSTPSAAIIHEPSSVHSSDNNSSSYKSRVQSSPAGPSKSPEHSRRDSQSTTHLVWPSRKPLHVRSTTTPERARKSSDQDDTTTDLRLSSYRQPMQMHYLPDLKEESHEDSSLNTSASNLKNSSFRFPNAGQPSIRASVDDSVLPTRNASLRSHRNSVLAQTRGLPSMNFSGMDLVANLDDLFGPHSARSFDATSEEVSEDACGAVRRSATDGAMREKYKSVFGALEGGERAAGAEQAVMDLMALKPRYTTRDFMSDIENLDVPSVRNLTERISELFPSLREASQRDESGEFVEEEQIMEHVIEELQGVAAPVQKRSEARLRPLPGSPHMMVVDDAVYEELTKHEKEGANTATRDETKFSNTTGRTPPVNGCTYGETPIAELEAPFAKLRPRSLSFGDRPSSRQSVRKSQLSLPSTPTASTDTHPWYNDKNFPWATTTIPSIDISLPPVRTPPRPAGPSPLRSRLSDSSARTVSSSQAGDGSGRAAHRSDSAGEARIGLVHRGAKYDIDGNLSPPHFDSSGYLAAPISARGAAQSHEAGDRYPTSSLSPPSHSNLPSLQHQAPARLSADSDDEITALHKRRLSILPRFSTSRHAASSSRAGDQATQAPQLPESSEAAQGETHDPSKSRRFTFVNARGLTRQEFEMARIKENVKSAWGKVKSGVKKVLWRQPSIQEIVVVRSPPRPGDREIPQEVQEARARMPESYYSFAGPAAPARRSRFSLFARLHRRGDSRRSA